MSKTVILHVDLRRLPRRPLYSTDKATCFRCGEKGHLREMCFQFRTEMCPNGSACHVRNCTNAHSESELRQPHIEKCVRVVKDKNSGIIYKLGCLQHGHTFRACPSKTCSLCGESGHWYYDCDMYPCNLFADPSKLQVACE